MAARVPVRAKKAERNNETLFPVFEQHLASDNIRNFTTTAEKLSNWLSVDRAYYSKARPMIVQLIETAHKNVYRQTGAAQTSHVTQASPGLQAWWHPYLALVRTVVPFYRLFLEKDLQLRLKVLFESAGLSVPPRQQSGPLPSSTSTTSPFAPTAFAPSPESSHVAPALSVSVTADIQNKISEIPAGDSSPSAPAPASPSTPALASPSAPADATMSSQPPKLPKMKKRKFVDDDDYIQADLNWYKDNQSTKPVPPPEAPEQRPVQVTPIIPVEPPPDAGSTTTAPTECASVQSSAATVVNTPLASGQPSQKPSRSGSHSISSQQVAPVKPRSPSSTECAVEDVRPAKPTSVDEPIAPSESRSPPSSPTLLAPSIQRRRSSELITVTSSHVKTETLPSPLTNRRAIVKAKRGKGKGPPGLKVLPIPPEHLHDASDTAYADDLTRVAVSPVVGAISPRAKDTTTSEDVPGSATATSLPPRPPSPPRPATSPPPPTTAPKSRPSTSPDASIVSAAHRPPANPDRHSTHDVPEDPATVMSESVVLHDTMEIVASPEPMDIDSDDLNKAAMSMNNRTTEEVTPAVQEGQLDTTMQSQQTTSADDRVEEVARATPSPGLQSHHNGDIDMREPSLQLAEVPAADKCGTEATEQETGSVQHSGNTIDVAAVEKQDARTPSEILSPFAQNCIRLLSIARGHSSYTPAHHPVELVFEVTAEETKQIERWRNRDTITGDLSESMCISLVCYESSQCTEIFAHKSGEPTLSPADIVHCGHPVNWPTDASVFAALVTPDDAGLSRSFMLSPPFTQCEPDRSVDLGARGIRPGINTLRLFQYRDLSELAFAVVLHHPTTAQLTELQRVRDQDRSWHEFLDGLGTFTLPAPTLVPPPLPKVNAVHYRGAQSL